MVYRTAVLKSYGAQFQKLMACKSAIKLLIHHINEKLSYYRLAQKCIAKSLIPNLF